MYSFVKHLDDEEGLNIMAGHTEGAKVNRKLILGSAWGTSCGASSCGVEQVRLYLQQLNESRFSSMPRWLCGMSEVKSEEKLPTLL